MPTWSEKEYQDYCLKKKSAAGAEKAPPPLPMKRNKYHNTRTEYNGKVYDSRREADRAAELQVLVRVGEVATILEQVSFVLPGGVKYRADFLILKKDGTFIIEDAKGVRTKEYQIKKKLMASLGLEIVEV